LRVFFLSLAFIPAYLLFTLALIVLSGLATRITGWRTPSSAELAIGEFSWPLLDWARYMVSIQLVRIFAGTLFRATPIWTFYMRLNGARMGRGVFVNSLEVTDHNLLDFGDGVIVGGDVHLSGHTVEGGILKTAPVRLGRGVTVGVGSVVGIGVVAGDGCQIGALSLVPKFTELEGGAVYVGIPVKKLEPR
jgi:acetyltransferase-like isoleucine patch superfamily enzyme